MLLMLLLFSLIRLDYMCRYNGRLKFSMFYSLLLLLLLFFCLLLFYSRFVNNICDAFFISIFLFCFFFFYTPFVRWIFSVFCFERLIEHACELSLRTVCVFACLSVRVCACAWPYLKNERENRSFLYRRQNIIDYESLLHLHGRWLWWLWKSSCLKNMFSYCCCCCFMSSTNTKMTTMVVVGSFKYNTIMMIAANRWW